MDKLKALFTDPKKRNIMLIGVAVVVVLAFFALRRKSSSGAADAGLAAYASYPSPSGSGGSASNQSDGDAAGAVASLSREFGDALKEQQEKSLEMQTAYNQKLTDIQTGFYTALAGQSSSLTDALNTQRSTFEEMMGIFENDLSGIQSQINEGLMTRAQQNITVYHSYEAPEPYTPISAITQEAPSTVEKIFGVGGADYNKLDAAGKKQMEQNESRIKNDPAYRESEKERANAAIREREAAGMDTKAQEDYLAKLNKAG